MDIVDWFVLFVFVIFAIWVVRKNKE